ncbi:MAG TPA: hypothetical protein VM925_16235 [Labilithrix sp.]|nr:hypothetical protein [Labilithrix sp.]
MAFITCPLYALVILLLAMNGTQKRERRLIQLGFLAHVAGTFAIVAYHSYVASGDMLGYAYYGRQLARLISTDISYLPEVGKLALHIDNGLPAVANYDEGSAEYLVGTTTTTMFALTGLVMTLVGPTLLATALVFGLFAFAGTAFLYKRLRPAFEEHERIPVLCAFMFVPSVVFWSSGIVKEAVLLGFFGFLCGGLYDLLTRPRVAPAIIVLVGAAGVGLVKPYVLFPFALSVGAWLNARSRRKHGWLTRLLAVVFALVALAALSRLFPQFGVEKLAETVAGQQGAGVYGTTAGSYIEVGAPEERTLLGQIRFIPLALVNSLARPFLFEAKNASMLLAGMETLAAGILVVVVARRHGIRGLYGRVMARPPFVAALVFTLSFGAAVGLTTTNLGTLSRYRLPLVPMYAGVLLAMRARKASPAAASEARRAPAVLPLKVRQRRHAALERAIRAKRSAS